MWLADASSSLITFRTVFRGSSNNAPVPCPFKTHDIDMRFICSCGSGCVVSFVSLLLKESGRFSCQQPLQSNLAEGKYSQTDPFQVLQAEQQRRGVLFFAVDIHSRALRATEKTFDTNARGARRELIQANLFSPFRRDVAGDIQSSGKCMGLFDLIIFNPVSVMQSYH